jgi:hypothetical protein
VETLGDFLFRRLVVAGEAIAIEAETLGGLVTATELDGVGTEFGVASVSLRSAKKPHPGGISWVPCGRARETDEERKLPSQPQPAAAMAC